MDRLDMAPGSIVVYEPAGSAFRIVRLFQERPIPDPGAINLDALRLGVIIAVGVVWLLARQRNLVLRWLSGYPLIVGLSDAVFVVLIAYALQGLLLFVSELPRMAGWSITARMSSELVVHLGYAWALARVAEALLRRRKAHVPDWRPTGLTRIGLYGLFTLGGILTFLVAKGHAPTELFVWTGATAAVLAFLVQQTLGDLVSGFALTIERPFKIGDWLRLEDGTEGQVQDVNWRATHLRKWDKTSFIIPNGQLAQQSFTNLRGPRHPFAPWYLVKVSGEHPPSQVIELLQKAVAGCNIPLPAPAPVVRLMSADSSPYGYMVWLHFADYPTMFAGRDELYREIDSVLRSAGISIAADIHEVRYRRSEAAPHDGGRQSES